MTVCLRLLGLLLVLGPDITGQASGKEELESTGMSWNQVVSHCLQTLMIEVLQEKLVPITEQNRHLPQESEKPKEDLVAAADASKVSPHISPVGVAAR